MKMALHKTLIVLAALCMQSISSQAQDIAINTDITQWALQTYNLGAEMTIGNRSTLALNAFANDKPYWHKDMKVIGVQPEYRYYFGGRPMYHHFIGVAALATDYNVTWKNKTYDGFAAGAGITFGYVVALSKRWNLDAHAGVGLVVYHHTESMEDHPMLETDISSYTVDGFTGYTILPTKIGVTLSYILR